MRRRNTGLGSPGGRAEALRGLLPTIPNTAFHYDEVSSAGDRVFARGRATGTNTGPLCGTPASGKPVDFQMADIARVESGRIVERWLLPDLLTMMRQVGLTPVL